MSTKGSRSLTSLCTSLSFIAQVFPRDSLSHASRTFRVSLASRSRVPSNLEMDACHATLGMSLLHSALLFVCTHALENQIHNVHSYMMCIHIHPHVHTDVREHICISLHASHQASSCLARPQDMRLAHELPKQTHKHKLLVNLFD